MRKQVHPKPYLDDLIAVIKRDGKMQTAVEAWKYNSIVDALYWADRNLSYIQRTDAAKKCCRTHEELTFKVGDRITIELKSEGREKNG